MSKILNHVENSVTAIYDRHSYDKEKKLGCKTEKCYLGNAGCFFVAMKYNSESKLIKQEYVTIFTQT